VARLRVLIGGVDAAGADVVVRATTSLDYQGQRLLQFARRVVSSDDEASPDMPNPKRGQVAVVPASAGPARWTILAAPPRWTTGGAGERELLAATWRAVIDAAASCGGRAVATPTLSSGPPAFPAEVAAAVTIPSIFAATRQYPSIESVSICLAGTHAERDREIYTTAARGNPSAPASGSAAEVGMEAEIERVVNRYRARNGLPQLGTDATLTAAARIHSRHMHDRGFFAHDDPYTNTDCMSRVLAIEPLGWRLVAENLIQGYETPRAIVDGWVGSPDHDKNLLLDDVRHIGTGVVLDGRRPTVTQLYGQRG